MKPVIGIVCKSMVEPEPPGSPWAGDLRYGVNRDYCAAIQAAGGLSLLLPTRIDETDIPLLLDRVDGLLLAGGKDVDPRFYNQPPLPLLEATDPERDAVEIALTRLADDRDLPVFGICRGQQVINVALGGTLFQDLSYARFAVLEHSQGKNPAAATHVLTTVPDSLCRAVLGKSHATNSFHHQLIDRLAPGLIAAAHASDGVIEAIERPGRRFFHAVQFHPERMIDDDDACLELFRRLVRSASRP